MYRLSYRKRGMNRTRYNQNHYTLIKVTLV